MDWLIKCPLPHSRRCDYHFKTRDEQSNIECNVRCTLSVVRWSATCDTINNLDHPPLRFFILPIPSDKRSINPQRSAGKSISPKELRMTRAHDGLRHRHPPPRPTASRRHQRVIPARASSHLFTLSLPQLPQLPFIRSFSSLVPLGCAL